MLDDHRTTLRFSKDDAANLAAVAASLKDDLRRPTVTQSDAIRAALRIAARAMQTAGNAA